MLRRWQSLALIGTAILCAAFAASFLFPAKYQICGPNEYTHAKECTAYYLGPFIFSWVMAWADVHNGLVTAIAGIFVAGFTGTLWKTSRAQASELKRSIDIQTAMELPFVFVNKIELLMYSYIPIMGSTKYDRVITDAIPPKDAKVQIAVKNYGRTPATVSRFSMMYTVAKELPPEPEYRGRMLSTGTIIGSDKEIDGEQFARILALTDGEREAIMMGTASLWVYGFIEYRDFLRNDHLPKFCFRWWGHEADETSDSPSGFFEDGPPQYR